MPVSLELLQKFMQEVKENAEHTMERRLSRGEHIDAHMALGAKRAIEELERKIATFESHERIQQAYERQHQEELARRRALRKAKLSVVA